MSDDPERLTDMVPGTAFFQITNCKTGRTFPLVLAEGQTIALLVGDDKQERRYTIQLVQMAEKRVGA